MLPQVEEKLVVSTEREKPPTRSDLPEELPGRDTNSSDSEDFVRWFSSCGINDRDWLCNSSSNHGGKVVLIVVTTAVMTIHTLFCWLVRGLVEMY